MAKFKMSMHTKGLESTQAIVDMLKQVTKMKAEGILLDTDRKRYVSISKDGTQNLRRGKVPTNQELLGYLKDGGRDITANAEDSQAIGQVFLDDYTAKMKLVGKKFQTKDRLVKGKLQKGRKGVVTQKKAARQGVASGLRKGLKYWSKTLHNRIKKQVDNSGSKLKPLSTTPSGLRYAQDRLRDYRVNPAVLLIASGQLEKALQKAKSKIIFGK